MVVVARAGYHSAERDGSSAIRPAPRRDSDAPQHSQPGGLPRPEGLLQVYIYHHFSEGYAASTIP